MALEITDEQFDQIITEALDSLPQEWIERLDNVAIVYADDPSPEQRQKLKLRCNETLLGLYEGIPMTKRNSGYNLVLPDKITLFKKPLLAQSGNLADFKEEVRHTLWHEIAHFFGLDHDRIHKLEGK